MRKIVERRFYTDRNYYIKLRRRQNANKGLDCEEYHGASHVYAQSGYKSSNLHVIHPGCALLHEMFHALIVL